MANVNAVYGPVLISTIIYAFLYGLATIQTLLFFKFNDKVHPANKVAVAVLWVMSGLDLAFISHFVYYYVILAASRGENERIPWSFTGYTAVDLSLLAFAQILYTVRLWQQVTDHKTLRAVVCSTLAALIGASIGLAIYLPVRMATAKSSTEYAKSSAFVLFALANGSLIDWILSCTLSFGLIKGAGRNFGWTDSSFVVFLAYVLNTGTFAALFSIATVISYALNDFSLAFVNFKIIHVALYFNSFLAMYAFPPPRQLTTYNISTG
ncbi:hypothetical protein PM082_016510 [Marasmius tenuissimus]|nr:hypothetical protein PM082_016510 [Marasmius tenuissimus]